ncbi:ABC transporter substrate-binding protein, partial [Streptomyces sp. CAI-17]|nr:ABC transporter substrate-binding protein [Streptomyces sp. CAI-17]
MLAAVLGGAATLAVAGCSSSGDAAAGQKKQLRIGYFAFPSGDLLVKNRGLLEKALPDHTISWVKFDSGAGVNQAFIGKSLEI